MSLIKDKVPLAVFSGGLDSTAVLHYLLGIYEQVDVLTIELHGQDNKIDREKKAADKIISMFESRKSDTYGSVRYINTSITEGLMPPNAAMSMNQAPGWIAAALKYCRPDTETVVMGYVKGDDQSMTFRDLQKAWDFLLDACGQIWVGNSRPSLWAPFLFHTKEDLLNKHCIPEHQHVSWCESSGDGNDCGRCGSCHRMMTAINNWKLLYPFSYDRDCNLKKRFNSMVSKWRKHQKDSILPKESNA